MAQDISTALNLFGIGMITVFIVLTLVVTVGNLLIKLVNKLPEAPVAKAIQPTRSDSIDPKTIAAIAAVVDKITEGKGNITHIEKTF